MSFINVLRIAIQSYIASLDVLYLENGVLVHFRAKIALKFHILSSLLHTEAPLHKALHTDHANDLSQRESTIERVFTRT